MYRCRLLSNVISVTAWNGTEDEHNPILDAVPDLVSDTPQTAELVYKFHVHLTCEPFTALDAPLTEFVVWDLKEGAEPATVTALLTKLMAVVNAIPREEGMHKAGWGSVIGDERKYVIMIGWDSMEVQFDFTRGHDERLMEEHRRSTLPWRTHQRVAHCSISSPSTR